MPVYIENINGNVDRPINQQTDRANIEQSACPKVRESKKVEICNVEKAKMMPMARQHQVKIIDSNSSIWVQHIDHMQRNFISPWLELNCTNCSLANS